MHQERMRIARDLHDTIGHTLSVASLHAAVASEATDPEARDTALAEVRGAASEALRELRGTVKVLRTDAAGGPAPALGLASREQVLETVRSAGLQVDEQVTVPAERLPRAVDAAAHRILQESVTNVLRHAGASRVQVRAELTGGVLDLRIIDDGAAGRDSSAAAHPGTGITGMRERAELLGGTLTAGPGPSGFTVHARLPLHGEEGT